MKFTPPKLNLHSIFMAAAYNTNERETRAQLPNICPCGLQDGLPCEISLNHNRVRVTGPGFVHVVQCKTHRKAFTIYPPGYVPYGRRAITSTVTPDGNSVILDGDDALQSFQQTMFDAAVDAANDKIWSKDCYTDPSEKRFNTQLRQIIRSIVMLGLSPEQAEKHGAVTEILNVPGQLLHENAAVMLDQKSTIRDAGQAVCNILEKLSVQAQTGLNVFMQLAICGHLAGLWPPLHWWCAKTGKLLSVDRYHLSLNARDIPL